jgi:hypothetical protein
MMIGARYMMSAFQSSMGSDYDLVEPITQLALPVVSIRHRSDYKGLLVMGLLVVAAFQSAMGPITTSSSSMSKWMA